MNHLRTVLITTLAALALAACAGNDAGPGTVVPDQDELGRPPRETTVGAAADTIPAVLRPGLQVTEVDFTTGVAALTNTGERDIDLTGYWIGNGSNQAELPSETLAPGDQVSASLGGFDPGGGEVAVSRSRAFDDPAAIDTYVAWGTGGEHLAVAIGAGIWEGDPVEPAGDRIVLSGAPGSAAGWS